MFWNLEECFFPVVPIWPRLEIGKAPRCAGPFCRLHIHGSGCGLWRARVQSWDVADRPGDLPGHRAQSPWAGGTRLWRPPRGGADSQDKGEMNFIPVATECL